MDGYFILKITLALYKVAAAVLSLSQDLYNSGVYIPVKLFPFQFK